MTNAFCALVGQHLLLGLLTKFPKCNFELDIPGILSRQSYTLSLTEYAWKIQNHALWDTLQNATLEDQLISHITEKKPIYWTIQDKC